MLSEKRNKVTMEEPATKILNLIFLILKKLNKTRITLITNPNLSGIFIKK